MKRATAAAYCDLSEAAFEREVHSGRLPPAVRLGGSEHWHKDAIDAALAFLAGDRADDAEAEFWNRGKAA
jgi:hypothetical protein